MAKKHTALAILVLCLGSASALFAQLRPPLDVSVTSIESQNGKKHATLHVQNNSGKDVAAYDVELTLTKADGTTQSTGFMHDEGYRATKNGKGTPDSPRLLNAGESQDQKIPLPSNVVNVSLQLGAVIYADRTAHGDPGIVDHITYARKKVAERVASEDPGHAATASKFAQPIDPAKIRRLP